LTGDIRALELTCQSQGFYVVLEMPIKRLTRATRKGQSKLAVEQKTSPGMSFNKICERRGFHRKGHHQ
jgi:hypothetical protein